MNYLLIAGVVIAAVILLKQINHFERGVILTMGKFTGVIEPGWRVVIPIFQHLKKVDMRIKAVDVPNQKAITADNVTVDVNAVIYYKINDAAKAVLEVENVYYAISQLAQTTMRNVIGEVELDALLSQRNMVSEKIREVVDIASDSWGVKVDNVELKDVSLPEAMERVIARQAEAERERRAVIIQAQGELAASENMAKAARVLSDTPGGLHLRTLQTLGSLSSDKSNTVVFALPVEILRAIEKIKQ